MSKRLQALRRQFLRLDLDGSGCISASELAQAMRDAQMGVEDGVTDKIIAEIDCVGNGKINYTEFLAATLTFGESMSDDMLRRLFQRFDVDDSGRISKENLLEAFKRLGRANTTLEEVTAMINAHDIAQDGQVSFQEFKGIFAVGREVSRLELTRQDSRFRPLVLTPALPEKRPLLGASAIVERDEEGSAAAASRAEGDDSSESAVAESGPGDPWFKSS